MYPQNFEVSDILYLVHYGIQPELLILMNSDFKKMLVANASSVQNCAHCYRLEIMCRPM